ncbi:MAG: CRISPR-associated endonuclease Cas3'' [Caulobacteraceae bacterium]
MTTGPFAHSLPGRPVDQWEPLSHHLATVGARASSFATEFGWAQAATVAGRLHDVGKTSQAYQDYIGQPRDTGNPSRGPDHSTAGAREAINLYGKEMGRMVAYAIAGHHAGLADPAELDRRLIEKRIEPYAGWEPHAGALPGLVSLAPTGDGSPSPHPGFSQAFLIRMIFSCLVDADFLETEAFYDRAKNQPTERGGHASLRDLNARLRDYMARFRSDSPINALRARVLEHAVGKAALAPGLFTLTVPTGGGKTLASLSFALEHAAQHGLRRVVYVVPFTSIIEQTAEVFREAMSAKDDVLEHHATFDWERAKSVREADDEGPSGLIKLRKAAENWDAPIVVTTAVQFFESLFAARPSRCRKLHNLAGAVIILDEAQTLPIKLLRPCMAALDELARNYGSSVVLCTATQPALLARDGFPGGFKIGEDRELAPDPRALYAALKRVKVEVLPGLVADDVISARFDERDQMLCIVNSRAHARKLFESIHDLPGATHLTTLMCPLHRRMVLAELRERLRNGEPVRLVATSLIEAGVDIDFPEVWRAAAGLDSIAQAAGRCNREGKLELGRTVVFVPAEAKPPHALESFWQATRPILSRHDDLLGLDAVRDYFSELYWQKGEGALDALEVDGRPGVLAAIRERHHDFSFPFRSLANAFHLIDDVMSPVIVPWDADAEALLRRIAAADRPRSGDLRRLQQSTVPIPRDARDAWLAVGALAPVHADMGEVMLAFPDKAHYREDIGLDLANVDFRSAESNMM